MPTPQETLEQLKDKSLSWGTHNPAHLAAKFLPVIKELNPEKYAEITKEYPDIEQRAQDDGDPLWSSEDASQIVSDMFDALEAVAPEGYYFGSTEGDGSDFGFWSDPDYQPEEPAEKPNMRVCIWCGSGYTLDTFDVHADNVEQALDLAVVEAEKTSPGLLLDVTEVEDEMAKDGHYDKETGEGDAVFNETYIYVDATREGATKPYYVRAENLRFEDIPEGESLNEAVGDPNDKVTKVFDWLVDNGLFTENELVLVTKGWGYNMETLDNACQVRFAMNAQQLIDEAAENSEEK